MSASPPHSPAASRRRSRPLALGLGLAVVLGWVLGDLAVFVSAGKPDLLLALLPGSAVALAVGAACGLALGLSPRLVGGALLLLTGVGSCLPFVVELHVSRAEHWLPRAAFLLVLAWLASDLCARRLRCAALPLGASLGLLGQAAVTLYLAGWIPPLAWTLAGALALLVASALPRRGARLLLGAVGLLGPLALLTLRALAPPPVLRADLAPPANVARDVPNLLLVVLDTVRAGSLAPYGYDVVTTPELDRFVRRHATLYRSARATSSWTLPSHASLFTGLLPSQHGATHSKSEAFVFYPGLPLRDDVPTMAGLLRARGYRTGAIVANTFALRPQLGVDRGYEHYVLGHGAYVGDAFALAQMTGQNLRVGHVRYRDAEWITDLALDWVDEVRADGAFFLTLNYFDAHWPYFPPEPYASQLESEVPDDPVSPPSRLLRLLYERELRYLDAQLARLLTGLEERGLFDDTVIVVTSDHGEAFGDHGTWLHDWTLYEEVVRVPLYLKPIGTPATAVVEAPVTSADVFDLCFAALGIPATELPTRPERPIDAEWYHLAGAGSHAISPPGVGLQPTADERRAADAIQRDLVSWIAPDGLKLIVASTGEVEAYDLSQDLRELHPLELSAERREAALRRARDWWAAHPPRSAPAGLMADDLEAWRREGAALGYAGGEGDGDD